MASRGLSKVFSALLEKLKYSEFSENDLGKIEEEFLLLLVENDVALEVAEGILHQLTLRLSRLRIPRLSDKEKIAYEELRRLLTEIFEKSPQLSIEKDLERQADQRGEPLSVVFLGPNGHGKTTTVAKLAYRFSSKGYRVVIAAADTFRAGAIEQLKELAERAGADLVSMGYGADPAAVAYEAYMYSVKRRADILLVDTAGRMHTRKNLMEEMRKIVRVLNPRYRIFVGDALVGNDAVDQARMFFEEVGFDGSILTKFDADTKGGIVLSIVYITSRPILYVGTGQRLHDLTEFNYRKYLEEILPSPH
uniref:Signal recognition particle-docking protein FtsY n=1 Tax=Thermofilum pendens TaxID=2269 RepID=A0A7C4F9M2_THEPE